MISMQKLTTRINRLAIWISGSALILMMALGFGNVVSRIFWRPIVGSFEIIGFLGAVSISLALGFTQIRKNHVAVDIFTDKYTRTWRRLTATVSYLITAPFFLIATRQVFIWGVTVFRSGEMSETLLLPYYPFIFTVAFGLGFLTLILFHDLYKAVHSLVTGEKTDES
ncbi:MAG: TRAP transporter small permease [Deltaproteobacteria bacterium]|nr:TRAP transporter small permease [Candidatus Anaeroferrophillacea bacterium]